MEEKKESRYPIVFDKCPNCGCIETVTQAAWAEEAEKGRVKKDTPVAAQHLQTPLLDPQRSPLLIGGLTGMLVLTVDYCVECGVGYCTGASVVEGKLQQGPPPGTLPGRAN